MFEDSLLESNHRIKTRSRYWSVMAILINSGAVIALVIWPLLHPQALPTQMMASLLVAPPPPIPPSAASPVVKVQVRSRSLESEIDSPSKLSHSTTMVTDSAELQTAVVALTNGQELSDSTHGSSIGRLFDGLESGRAVAPSAPHPARQPVSSVLMQGNLIDKTTPLYPAIAREARIQGTVVLQATIGKAGEIENLRVVSGPPMLRQAALDAVRSWRYKPFLLNGNPVEVETTINVVFTLGG